MSVASDLDKGYVMSCWGFSEAFTPDVYRINPNESGAEGKWSWNPEVITTCLSGRLSNVTHVGAYANDKALAPQLCLSDSITLTELWEEGAYGNGEIHFFFWGLS